MTLLLYVGYFQGESNHGDSLLKLKEMFDHLAFLSFPIVSCIYTSSSLDVSTVSLAFYMFKGREILQDQYPYYILKKFKRFLILITNVLFVFVSLKTSMLFACPLYPQDPILEAYNSTPHSICLETV